MLTMILLVIFDDDEFYSDFHRDFDDDDFSTDFPRKFDSDFGDDDDTFIRSSLSATALPFFESTC